MNIAYVALRSNFEMPNLIVHPVQGVPIDISASMANIELGYGSNTKCDEKEARRRRQQKEKLKMLVLAYILGADLSDQDKDIAKFWVLPEYHDKKSAYTYFADREEEE